jgi:hypothetical protein
METFFIIIGVVVVGIWLLGAISLNRNVSRYRNTLQLVINTMDEPNYKDTEIYKERVAALKEQGWVETSLNLMQDLRTLTTQEFNVVPAFFKRDDVLNIEYLFIMKYAVAHGYADEFQRSMVLGKKIEKMMEGKS